MNEKFDVIVVGGGPAGAIAAGDLALKGRSVLDCPSGAAKFPQEKIASG